MLRRFCRVGLVVVILAIGLVLQSGTLAQTASMTVSTEGSEHDFDFLLGNWDFTAESRLPGLPPTYTGRWTFERTGNGALVEDDFMAVDELGVRRYLGVTVRAFDATTKRWTTSFVVPPGATWRLGAAWREGNEIAEGPLDTAIQKTRARFSDVAKDHFTWTLDQSTDNGKTWVNMVRVRARR